MKVRQKLGSSQSRLCDITGVVSIFYIQSRAVRQHQTGLWMAALSADQVLVLLLCSSDSRNQSESFRLSCAGDHTDQ